MIGNDTDKIIFYEDLQHHEHGGKVRDLAYVDFMRMEHGKRVKRALPADDDIQGTVRAYISWGRWVIQCPACPGALNASRDDDRFICVYCGNIQNDRNYLRVVYPRSKKRIEEALMKRPGYRMDSPERSWQVWETLQDLNDQNAQNGL